MKKLENVVFLATSHNVSKAYISRCMLEGIRPSKTILLNIKSRKSKKQTGYLFLIKSKLNKIRRFLKRRFTSTNHENIHLNELMMNIEHVLGEAGVYTTDLSLTTEQVLEANNLDFERLEVESINDRVLVDYLKHNVNEKYVVFMGGGILRNNLLRNSGKRFIHIHPGVVPDVKGADCILWSALVKHELGMSAFFMNEGIDTGDIIKLKTYQIPKFNLSGSIPLNKIKNLIINFVDPHYRADTLVSILKAHDEPGNWQTTPQNPNEGKTYYFMHKEVLKIAVSKFAN
jgi:hypothetical protein